MKPCDTRKKREICFHPLHPAQAAQALALLNGLENLQVVPGRSNSIVVFYCITDYTLQGLERALAAQGFHLDNSLLQKMKRALVYYIEEVQFANLKAPVPELKQREISVKAYERHLHGDRDETPEEWREYR